MFESSSISDSKFAKYVGLVGQSLIDFQKEYEPRACALLVSHIDPVDGYISLKLYWWMSSEKTIKTEDLLRRAIWNNGPPVVFLRATPQHFQTYHFEDDSLASLSGLDNRLVGLDEDAIDLATVRHNENFNEIKRKQIIDLASEEQLLKSLNHSYNTTNHIVWFDGDLLSSKSLTA